MKVAVLGGGSSSEHVVSLASARSIADELKASDHTVVEVTITEEGQWLTGGEPITLSPGKGLLNCDVVFPALHGPYGEDGTVQGVLEMLATPYVGCNVATSAICVDKVLFKQLASSQGFDQVEYVALTESKWQLDSQQVLKSIDQMGYPVFVKPARLGSSVGIERVTSLDALEAAVEAALKLDPRVIVEAASSGREIECAIVGPTDSPDVSVPGEVIFDGEWYDYNSKYTAGGMRLQAPAELSSEQVGEIQNLAITLFKFFGCSGLARVDFFVEEDRTLVNEINTMPGFTETSVYPKLFAATGKSYGELLEQLLISATS